MEHESLIYIEDFNPETITFKPLSRKQGQMGAMVYADCVCSFDIETTRIEEREQSIMYVWQWAIEDVVIYGRTWEQFRKFLRLLKARLGDMHLMCFIHNASYEFQFLSGIYRFNDYEVFCTDSRKVLKFSMYKNFEFRCSYKLTNLSLAAMAKRYNKKYLKESGVEFDYSKRRFSDTPLTELELRYCAHDVLAVVESIHAILEINGDNLYSIPLTSTGFVRRDIKAAMQDYRLQMLDDMPDYRCYQLLKSAFRGGNTHANRYYAGCVIDNVTSMDISSSYPSQQCNKKFPIGKWTAKNDLSVYTLHQRLDRGAAAIMRVYMYDVKLRDRYEPVPYIPVAKCLQLRLPDDIKRGLCVDNGRVLQADFIEFCCTDLDLVIIDKMYKFKLEIQELYINWYDVLPRPIRGKNIEYFRKKTELKGVDGQELYYFKNKELLNSIYIRDECTRRSKTKYSLCRWCLFD